MNYARVQSLPVCKVLLSSLSTTDLAVKADILRIFSLLLNDGYQLIAAIAIYVAQLNSVYRYISQCATNDFL